MNLTRTPFKSLLALAVLGGTLASACTSDKNGQPRMVVVQQTSFAQACSEDGFQTNKVSAVHAEVSTLPEGLYLYSKADMQVEQGKSRIVVSEIPMGGEIESRVACVTRGQNETLETSLNGLTKIEVNSGDQFNGQSHDQSNGQSNHQSKVTVRQFQAFVRSSTHGSVALNPRLHAKPVKTLNDFLSSNAGQVKFYRIDSNTYLMQVTRESAGQRVQLRITYDYISPM